MSNELDKNSREKQNPTYKYRNLSLTRRVKTGSISKSIFGKKNLSSCSDVGKYDHRRESKSSSRATLSRFSFPTSPVQITQSETLSSSSEGFYQGTIPKLRITRINDKIYKSSFIPKRKMQSFNENTENRAQNSQKKQKFN